MSNFLLLGNVIPFCLVGQLSSCLVYLLDADTGNTLVDVRGEVRLPMVLVGPSTFTRLSIPNQSVNRRVL